MCFAENIPNQIAESENLEEVTQQDRIGRMNEGHANNLRQFIELGIFEVDIENRTLFTSEDGVEYFTFLPFIYPEITEMAEDDWFSVFANGDNEGRKYIGKLRFTGLPAQDEAPETIKLGCSFVFVSNEPVTMVSMNIVTNEEDVDEPTDV